MSRIFSVHALQLVYFPFFLLFVFGYPESTAINSSIPQIYSYIYLLEELEDMHAGTSEDGAEGWGIRSYQSTQENSR